MIAPAWFCQDWFGMLVDLAAAALWTFANHPDLLSWDPNLASLLNLTAWMLYG